MAQWKKLLDRVLSGLSDANIDFAELRGLLDKLGFTERIAGDHYIFTRRDIEEIINIQPLKDGKAKPYHVKQIRGILRQHGITTV